jgi:hypothetical protein
MLVGSKLWHSRCHQTSDVQYLVTLHLMFPGYKNIPFYLYYLIWQKNINYKFYNLGYLFLLILDFTYQTEHIFYIPEAHLSLYHIPDYKIIIFPILSIFTQLIKFPQYFKYTG